MTENDAEQTVLQDFIQKNPHVVDILTEALHERLFLFCTFTKALHHCLQSAPIRPGLGVRFALGVLSLGVRFGLGVRCGLGVRFGLRVRFGLALPSLGWPSSCLHKRCQPWRFPSIRSHVNSTCARLDTLGDNPSKDDVRHSTSQSYFL